MKSHKVTWVWKITGGHTFKVKWTKARRHNNRNCTYVKTSSLHGSIEEQFDCPGCLQHFATIHELKSHYYSSDHPKTIPTTRHQQQRRQITNNDDSEAHSQEIATASDDSEEAHHQESTTSNDGVPTTEQPEQSAEQNKRRASRNGSIENELLNQTCIYFPPPDPQNHFMIIIQSLNVSMALFNFQRSILNNKWKLTLEDHMHSAMAVHSILFLSIDQHSYNDISSTFF